MNLVGWSNCTIRAFDDDLVQLEFGHWPAGPLLGKDLTLTEQLRHP